MLPPHLPERRRRVPRVANLGAADRASSFSFTLGARAAQSNPNQIRGTIDAVARSMDAVGASGGGNRGGTAEVTQRNMEDLLRDEFTGGDPLTRSMRYTPVRPTRKLFCHGSSLLVQNLKAHTDERMVLELVKKFVFRPDDVGEVQVRDASPGTRLAVVTLRTRNLAKLVREELEGRKHDGCTLVAHVTRVHRVKVGHLSPFVTNELLRESMARFGTVELAVVVRDEKTGRSAGFGYVEYETATQAAEAVMATSKQPYLLTRNPMPITVSRMEAYDTQVGIPHLPGDELNPKMLEETRVAPHFAEPRTLEFRYAMIWQQLYDKHEREKDALRDAQVGEEGRISSIQKQEYKAAKKRVEEMRSHRNLVAKQKYCAQLQRESLDKVQAVIHNTERHMRARVSRATGGTLPQSEAGGGGGGGGGGPPRGHGHDAGPHGHGRSRAAPSPSPAPGPPPQMGYYPPLYTGHPHHGSAPSGPITPVPMGAGPMDAPGSAGGMYAGAATPGYTGPPAAAGPSYYGGYPSGPPRAAQGYI